MPDKSKNDGETDLPIYLRTNGPETADIDLYTAFSIFIRNLPRTMTKLHEAVDNESTESLKKLLEKFNIQCKKIYLVKISEEIESFQKALDSEDFEQLRTRLDNLDYNCRQITLVQPKIAEMLLGMKDYKNSMNQPAAD